MQRPAKPCTAVRFRPQPPFTAWRRNDSASSIPDKFQSSTRIDACPFLSDAGNGSSESFCGDSWRYIFRKVHPCPDGVVVDGSSQSFCDSSLKLSCENAYPCPDGEIGRRKGLKIPRWKRCAGSSPAPGTKFISHFWPLRLLAK